MPHNPARTRLKSDVGKPLPAGCSRDCQCAQLPGPDVLDCRDRGGKRHLHSSSEQISDHWRVTTIRYMDHLDASHCFTSEMGYGLNAGRAHADPSLKEGA